MPAVAETWAGGSLWVHMQREHKQGTSTGCFEVDPASAGEDIKELPPALVDLLIIPIPQGRGEVRCLERGAWRGEMPGAEFGLSQAH